MAKNTHVHVRRMETIMGDIASTLTRIIEGGYFTYTPDDMDYPVYENMRKTEGDAATELRIAEKAARLEAFGSHLESIACGVAALAASHPQSVFETTDRNSLLASRLKGSHGYEGYKRFVALNPFSRPGYEDAARKDWLESPTFSPLGVFPVSAVVLEVANSEYSKVADVTFVCPAWNERRSLATITIDPFGWCVGAQLDFYENNELVTKGMLPILLGTEMTDRDIYVSKSYGFINQILGFPGATALLLSDLPHLGERIASWNSDTHRSN